MAKRKVDTKIVELRKQRFSYLKKAELCNIAPSTAQRYSKFVIIEKPRRSFL